MTSHDLLKLPFPSSGNMDVIRRFWIVDMNPWVLDIVKVGNLGIRGNLGSKMGLIRNDPTINSCELEFKNQ